MAWKMNGKPQTMKCNHALSAKFASMEPAPNDRPVRLSNKKAIRNAILEGRFRTCEWASVECKQTGKTYRVNGKHTSTILSEMNGEAPKDLYVIVEEYLADTLEDVAKLYATFDLARSSRTTGDINYAYAASVPELSTMPRKLINLCATGMHYHFNSGKAGGSASKVNQDVRAQRLIEYPEYVEFMGRVVGGRADSIKKLARGPVAAAMFATWQKDPQAASDFWILVREETHPDAKNASRKLAKFLTVAGVRASRGNLVSATEHEMYVKCLHAWNAWRKGLPTNLQYHADKQAPDIV
jgi:hypothetical protein